MDKNLQAHDRKKKTHHTGNQTPSSVRVKAILSTSHPTKMAEKEIQCQGIASALQPYNVDSGDRKSMHVGDANDGW